ncbi:preprotein translocase subunit SecD [Amycolatopsis pretoriensis]|uniref:Preprotein translocase subunit SecD n=1 Tax=Amycolatopsis pretoriensis TaxID=218821 RepID=A0A1H5QFR0_9PSEU|nr:precorrin-3B C(17)-methyltransferase [Amycolatopsis pretoriensis]SEF24915.1 preprotein translocase subunit SecD [Amycolatopsis pretoriensis]
MGGVRILLLAAVAVLATGCQAEVAGHAAPTGFIVKDGTQLRFRPVLAELPPGPATGSAGDRQSTDPAVQQAAAQAFDCAQGKPDPLGGRDDPALPLVSCDRAQGTKYILGPGFLSGADVSRVDATLDPQTGSSVINLSFTAKGARTWAEWTGQNVGKQVAVVLRSRVLTAPAVQSAITGGETQITGKFTLPEARQLARDIAGG